MGESSEGDDLKRMGLFKEMGYLQGHVPISAMVFNESASKKKQMMTMCSKTKKATQDGYFDKKFRRAFEGDPGFDLLRFNRMGRLKNAKKILGPTFQYSSPGKKPCGLGSNYGTFDEHVQKMFGRPEREETDREEPEKAEIKSLKNIYTNPGKKGTGYGYPNVTIGKVPPYFLDKELEELQDAEPSETTREPRPFEPYRAGLFQQGYFDPNPYRGDEELSEAGEEEKGVSGDEGKTPFMPSGPAKKDGGMKAGCLSSYPTHTDGPHPQESLVPRGVKHYVNREEKMFLPIPVGPKPYPILSIINKNVQRKITPMNYTTVKGVVYCKK